MRGSTRPKRHSKAGECAGVCAPRAGRRFHAPVWQLLTTISSFCPGFRVRITLLTLNRFRERVCRAFRKSFGLTLSPLLWIQNRARGEPRARKCMQPTHEQCAAASPISDVPPPRWLGLRPGQRCTENEHGKWTQQPELLHSESGVCARDTCVCMYVAEGGTDGPALGREGWGVDAEVRQRPSANGH